MNAIEMLAPQEMAASLAADPPVAIQPIDLDGEERRLHIAPSSTGLPYRHLLALLRRGGRPLGWVRLPVPADNQVDLTPLREAFPSPPAGGETSSPPSDAFLSVVFATCANPEMAVRCVESILAALDGRFEVIVVENRPEHVDGCRCPGNDFPGGRQDPLCRGASPRARFGPQCRPQRCARGSDRLHRRRCPGRSRVGAGRSRRLRVGTRGRLRHRPDPSPGAGDGRPVAGRALRQLRQGL